MENKFSKSIYIFYSQFYDGEKNTITVGGIQNYITGLINIFCDKYDIYVIQKDVKTYEKYISNRYTIKSHDIGNSNIAKKLYLKESSNINDNDIIIWASDRISYKTKHKKTIAIQHGITFDFIDYSNIKFGSLLKNSLLFSFFYRQFQYLNAIRYFLRSKNIVCVDYNFLNWIRTILPRNYTDRAIVITNYSQIIKQNFKRDKEVVRILFARRFVDYRGVYILIDVVKSVLDKYNNVEFGIYGEGPLENTIRQELGAYNNVVIDKYSSKEALQIFKKYHISLIPTIGSEGTSFSLIESMSAGCIPLATNVGGMTNVVLDGFNGYLLNPKTEDFIDKIFYLIENKDEISKISKNALKTVEMGFSHDKWADKWQNLIDKI